MFHIRQTHVVWYKRVRPFCICFYCICCGARGVLRRILHPFRRVTAQASRNSAHDSEGEGKRGLGMGFHRVNYTIFAALCVNLRGRFSLPRKVSVVRREQIRVLIKTAPLPVHPRCGRPLVGGYAQTAAQTAAAFQLFNLSTAAQGAAQTAAESSNIPPSIYSKTVADPFVPIYYNLRL